jgi:alpha-L-arabinofuranosidase
MSTRLATLFLSAVTIVCAAARAQDARIVLHADQTVHRVSRYLTGACIEDVNHEIYGGLYSQMIFDGQNDNGWDQGLLFLNPSQVSLQPPGYVTRMISRNYQPLLVKSEVQSPGSRLDVTAKRSDDGKTLVLQAVNSGEKLLRAAIRLEGFAPSKPAAAVEELSGPLDAVNTADAPLRIAPRHAQWQLAPAGGQSEFTFAPYSFTVIRLE